MRYYFTKSSLVQAILKQDCGHLAIEFGQGDHAVVIESTALTGVRPQWRKAFLAQRTVVHCLERELPLEKDLEYYERVVSRVIGRGYDYRGASWLGLVTLLGISSLMNPVGRRDDLYCTEVLSAQKDWLAKHGFDTSKLENQLLKPHDAYEMLLETGLFQCLKLA